MNLILSVFQSRDLSNTWTFSSPLSFRTRPLVTISESLSFLPDALAAGLQCYGFHLLFV